MLTAILLLIIFDTGLILLCFGAVALLRKEQQEAEKKLEGHIDKDIETAVTAIYNMDSVKQKVTMNGRCEI